MRKGIPVLMYHALEDDSHPVRAEKQGEQIYILQQSVFEAQMQYLSESGFQSLLFSELALKEDWPEHSVILTFDDGHESNHSIALPILKKYGLKAEFFITTDWIDSKNYMTKSMIKELYDSGMLIGSHGKSHKFLSDLNDSEIEHELLYSKATIEKIIGDQIYSFSAPGGRLDKRVVKIAKKIGYRWIFGSNPVINEYSHLNHIIGRFGIKKGQPFAHFVRIVNGRPPRQYFLYYNALKIFKKLLGNRAYENVRNLVLKVGSSFLHS